jgi:hypothetical protein
MNPNHNNPVDLVSPLTVGADVSPLTSAPPAAYGASADIIVTPQEDEAMNRLTAEEVAEIAPRHEEWHITVKGDPVRWADFCREHDLKPLFIELQGGATQLMCASSFDPSILLLDLVDENERQLFTIIRVKHEVSVLRDGERALYYEAHVKFNGPWRTDRKGVSRDLYRAHEQRWYMTHRQATPFDAAAFGAKATVLARPSRFDEVEYEACILDTNPALDGGWL